MLSRLIAPLSYMSVGLLCGLLSGCALKDTANDRSPLAVPAISGVAYGGQQPIAGARVYLLAANPSGYGSGSLSLLTAVGTGVAVDSIGAYATTLPGTGGFNLAPAGVAEYSCTTGYTLGASTASGGTALPGNEQVYLYVLGGNAGSGTNDNIGLLAALGPCNAPYATQGIVINEITTVAAAYAFAGYAIDATHIASSGRSLALTGLANAGLNSANLVDIKTGLPLAGNSAINRPVAAIYTLADILAACVNGASGNGNCNTLLQYTRSAGATGTPATDTATATINLAHNPWPTATGMSSLYALQPATGAPFAGGLTGRPNDFTLALNYAGTGNNSYYSLAIDGSGNVYTADFINSTVYPYSSTACALQDLQAAGSPVLETSPSTTRVTSGRPTTEAAPPPSSPSPPVCRSPAPTAIPAQGLPAPTPSRLTPLAVHG